MARPATGSIRERKLASKQTAYDARFSLPRGQYPGVKNLRVDITLGTTPHWSLDRAEAELQRILAQVGVGAWVDPRTLAGPAPAPPPNSDPTVHVVSSKWWAKAKRKLDEDTIRDYLDWRLRRHILPYWKDWPVSTIGVADIDAWVEKKLEQGLSAESVNKLLNTLANILDLARDYDYGGMQSRPNPAVGKNRKAREENKGKRARQASWLNYDQVMVLFDAADRLERESTRYGTLGRAEMMKVFFCCGLRVSELCDLRWGAIDLSLGVISVLDSKTPNGIRPVPMPSMVIRALREWKLRSPCSRVRDWVFPTDTGQQRTRHSVRQRILGPVNARATVLAKRADIDWPENLGTHAGRRSCVTYLVACKVDVGTIQEIVGHADSRTTMGIYRQRQYLKQDPRYRQLMHGPHEVLAAIDPGMTLKAKKAS